jgi:hypothetical protein
VGSISAPATAAMVRKRSEQQFVVVLLDDSPPTGFKREQNWSYVSVSAQRVFGRAFVESWFVMSSWYFLLTHVACPFKSSLEAIHGVLDCAAANSVQVSGHNSASDLSSCVSCIDV